MGYDFDGINRIIQLTPGTTALDVKDLYSKWKEWFRTGGSSYGQAFNVVGGEPVDEGAGIYITSYFYLLNGWKVRPQEYSHTLSVTNGILLTSDGSDPFIQTQGYYNVMIKSTVPIKSETINIGGGGGASASDIWNYSDRTTNLPNSVQNIINYVSSQTTIMGDNQLPTIYNHLMMISSQLKEGVKTDIDWTMLNKIPRAM